VPARHFAPAGLLVFALSFHALLFLWLFRILRAAFSAVVDGCYPLLWVVSSLVCEGGGIGRFPRE